MSLGSSLISFCCQRCGPTVRNGGRITGQTEKNGELNFRQNGGNGESSVGQMAGFVLFTVQDTDLVSGAPRL